MEGALPPSLPFLSSFRSPARERGLGKGEAPFKSLLARSSKRQCGAPLFLAPLLPSFVLSRFISTHHTFAKCRRRRRTTVRSAAAPAAVVPDASTEITRNDDGNMPERRIHSLPRCNGTRGTWETYTTVERTVDITFSGSILV